MIFIVCNASFLRIQSAQLKPQSIEYEKVANNCMHYNCADTVRAQTMQKHIPSFSGRIKVTTFYCTAGIGIHYLSIDLQYFHTRSTLTVVFIQALGKNTIVICSIVHRGIRQRTSSRVLLVVNSTINVVHLWWHKTA